MSNENCSVLIFPSGTNENDYIDRVVDILNGGGYTAVRYSFGNLIRARGRKVIILNWIENQSRQRGFLGLILVVGFVLTLKMLRYRVVWVIHNKKSHNIEGRYQNFLNRAVFRFLSLVVNKKVCHGRKAAKLFDADFVPHPVYKISQGDNNSEYKDCFVVFGRVSRYKRMEHLLAELPLVKVVIMGEVASDYRTELLNLIKKSKADVHLIDRFVPNEQLNAILKSCRGVLVSNDGQSSIVSGSVYHGLSVGTPVFTVSSPLYDEIGELRGFYLLQKWSQLNESWNISDRESEKPSITDLNSDSMVLEKLARVL